MAVRSSFLLRIDEKLLDQVRKWADDEFRSVNAQIEFLLREALRNQGRLPKTGGAAPQRPESASGGDEQQPE